ncbi:hypothetical protein GUITHDRAFT_163034 [Guillardia theta CCMP2712]|uniref:Uncharacterized protein n=1 Tax=Guillardia theta (strain CCMP2712) TaxID=905079 RepID=L1JDV3_GUITC|nr:hypothetical protein GUITHDRAFT_163034 [Guillardia theta CCMP2712]EKX46289.1 hypothetical protein GUITHDRAFT_163034 [Guillardia theta CCMP2712]|eukprot:XP_005833269.1 hypothetical protein GUITHDRAFT_163034 [Guillardia theta CCMP2712]
MKLLSNSSRGDLGLDACPGAVSGACGWYMVERDMGAKGAAKGAVEMISNHLVKELREQVVEKVWHFEKHNPRGMEMLQVSRVIDSFLAFLWGVLYLSAIAHYAWIVVFLLHGAYCLRDGLTIEENTKHVFLVLGVLSWLIVIVIVVRYSLSYRQTFKELHIAMEGFEKTWDRVVSKSSTKLDEISNEVLVISLKLKAWTTREASLWERSGSGVQGDVYLNITSIKNRYDRKYDFQSCGGYRDLCVCFEVRAGGKRRRRNGVG